MSLNERSLDREAWFELRIIETRLKENQVLLQVQAILAMAGDWIVRIIEKLTAREIFKRCIKIKRDPMVRLVDFKGNR